MKVLFVGDIVGKPGREILKNEIQNIKSEYGVDVIIANGENAAAGRGITFNIASEIFDYGVNVLTMGNHTWARKEIFNFIDTNKNIIRPANFPNEAPGKGSTLFEFGEYKIAVINLSGRVYMEPMDCPFKAVQREINKYKKTTKIIIVDIHAEATSEKIAMAKFLDGKVSCVVGTHTHVQTADEIIQKKGTAYITDVGMTGPSEGILGVKKDLILKKFTLGLPVKFELAEGKTMLNAVIIDIDNKSGKANKIQRIIKKGM